MKKLLFLLIPLLLISCDSRVISDSGNYYTKPGDISIHSSHSDFLGLLGYYTQIDDGKTTDNYQIIYFDDLIGSVKTIEFDGNSYSVKYLYSEKNNYVHITVDYYQNIKDESTNDIIDFEINHETGNVIGYINQSIDTTKCSEEKKEQDLIMIASNELSKIVSDYYNETSVIESGLNDKSIVIRFYNKISEIETMDYSIVRLTYDGKLKALFSRSNVELHNKYQDCEINTEDFDLTVKDAIDKHYPNYQRDDDTVFINIIYKDCYIKNRWLTTDNDGDLIIVYSARAIFDYEIKYKNEEAIIAEDKGLPIQGNGQTELPVTAIVKAIK